MARIESVVDDDMRPEHDLTGGVRGKHYKVLREEGHIVRICSDDGTVTDRRVAGERTVTLEPDVYEYCPNSRAANYALRTLVSLVPEKPLATATASTTGSIK